MTDTNTDIVARLRVRGGQVFGPAVPLEIEAASHIEAQATEIEGLRKERDDARGIVRDIYWMALRYADGRKSYAVSMCNDAVQKAYDGGWITPKDQGGDPITPRLARDGMAAEWQSIEARGESAEAKVRELETALRPFVADKLPSTKQTIRDYDEHGLRRMMSPMEIARKAARASLSPKGT